MLEKIRNVGEYVLAVALMYAGAQTAFNWQSDTVLSQVFTAPIMFLLFGIAFVSVGAGLVISKVMKRAVGEGYFLYTAFLLLLFSLILEATIFVAVAQWIDNLILVMFALVMRVGYFIQRGRHHD